MTFKQRLSTILLGLLFATVLTDQASALYDPGVGRFCSRDPIGYVGGQLSLLNYVDSRPTFFVDPLGWELTLVPARIENHPWSHKPLNRGTLGETNAVFSVTCKCKTHWDWFGVCYRGMRRLGKSSIWRYRCVLAACWKSRSYVQSLG